MERKSRRRKRRGEEKEKERRRRGEGEGQGEGEGEEGYLNGRLILLEVLIRGEPLHFLRGGR